MYNMDRFSRYEEEFHNSTNIVSRAERSIGIATTKIGYSSRVDANYFHNHQNVCIINWFPLIDGRHLSALTGILVEAEGELFEAEGYLKAMEIEKSCSLSDRYNNVFRRCRDEYEVAIRIVEKLKVMAKSASIKGGVNFINWSLNQTEKQRIENQLAVLESSKSIVNETDKIGSDILSVLKDNREALLGAKINIDETKQSSLEAGEILVIIENRVDLKFRILLLLIILLLAAILSLVYFSIMEGKYKWMKYGV